jgi:hypothetical protein
MSHTNNQETFLKPKPPENIQGNLSVINMIRQTCIRLACKEVLKINLVVCRQDARPVIDMKSSPMMVENCF